MSRTRCVVCLAVKGHGAATVEDAMLTASKMEAKNLRENMVYKSLRRLHDKEEKLYELRFYPEEPSSCGPAFICERDERCPVWCAE